jgi:hypothetical protein
MRNLTRITRWRRLACLVGTSALMAGGALTLTAASSAGAAACPGAATAPFAQTCDMDGTLTMTAGALGLEPPATLAWAETMDGTDQQLIDTSDTTYSVQDATGSGAGWNVTASATTFTGTTDPANVLPDGSLSTNGSTGTEAATLAPSAPCATGSTCTPPTETGITYPVTITTAGSPWSIYNATAGTGAGTFLIGGSSTVPAVTAVPVGWWLSVPGNVAEDTYTSTITLAIFSGPTGTV